MSIRNAKISTRFLLVFLTIFLIFLFLFSGCKHVLQLPKKSELNLAKSGKIEFTSFEDIKNAHNDPNNLIIMTVGGPEATAAIEVGEEFMNSTGMKTVIFELSFEDFRKTIRLLDSRALYEVVDVLIYPGSFVGEITQFCEELDKRVIGDDFEIGDYFPGIFKLVSEYGGKIKGIPVSSSIFSLIFRKDIFMEKGVASDKVLTYEEYYKYLEDFNAGPSIENSVLFDPSELNVCWSNRLWSLGGLTTNEDWKLTINNEIGNKSIEMLQTMFKFSSENIFDKSYDDIFLDF